MALKALDLISCEFNLFILLTKYLFYIFHQACLYLKEAKQFSPILLKDHVSSMKHQMNLAMFQEMILFFSFEDHQYFIQALILLFQPFKLFSILTEKSFIFFPHSFTLPPAQIFLHLQATFPYQKVIIPFHHPHSLWIFTFDCQHNPYLYLF